MNRYAACIIFFLLPALSLFSQRKMDVVYLKNASVIKGVIIENKINDHIKIKTADGSVFQYQYDEIDRIAIEEAGNSSGGLYRPYLIEDHTGRIGLGILLSSVGSGAGIHYNLTKNTAFDFNALVKGILLSCNYCFEETTVHSAFMAAGSVNQFLKTVYKQHKKKTKRHGISVKGGHSFGDIQETFLALNWIQENIKDRNQNHSFLFELGGGIINMKSKGEPFTYTNGNTTSFLLNIKVHWNWYLP